MKKTSFVASLLVAGALGGAAAGASADVGIGTQFDGMNTYGINVPIRLGAITIEPEIISSSDSEKYHNATSGNNQQWGGSNTSVGTGIYLRKEVAPSTEIYYGARVGMYSWNNKNTSPGFYYSDKESGYYLAPTVGAEYFFVKKVSIGLDLGLNYSKGTEKLVVPSWFAGTDTYDRTSLSTTTRLMLRAYF